MGQHYHDSLGLLTQNCTHVYAQWHISICILAQVHYTSTLHPPDQNNLGQGGCAKLTYPAVMSVHNCQNLLTHLGIQS